jgi:hypothetical protein
MANVKSRVERLEDRLKPKAEITGPYPRKKVTEEWLVEFCRLVQEHNEKYPSDPTFRDYSEALTPEIRDAWKDYLVPSSEAVDNHYR